MDGGRTLTHGGDIQSMPLSSYTIADSLGANQVWTRTGAEKGLSLYVNDTLRITGVRRSFELKARQGKYTDKSVTPNVVTPTIEWTHKVQCWVAGHNRPVEVSRTYRIPESLRNTVATTRAVFKDCNLALNALSDTDAELDEIADGRTQ